jgi:hypothetical protein
MDVLAEAQFRTKAAQILHPASKSPAKESKPPRWLHRNEAHRGVALA